MVTSVTLAAEADFIEILGNKVEDQHPGIQGGEEMGGWNS